MVFEALLGYPVCLASVIASGEGGSKREAITPYTRGSSSGFRAYPGTFNATKDLVHLLKCLTCRYRTSSLRAVLRPRHAPNVEPAAPGHPMQRRRHPEPADLVLDGPSHRGTLMVLTASPTICHTNRRRRALCLKKIGGLVFLLSFSFSAMAVILYIKVY